MITSFSKRDHRSNNEGSNAVSSSCSSSNEKVDKSDVVSHLAKHEPSRQGAGCCENDSKDVKDKPSKHDTLLFRDSHKSNHGISMPPTSATVVSDKRNLNHNLKPSQYQQEKEISPSEPASDNLPMQLVEQQQQRRRSSKLSTNSAETSASHNGMFLASAPTLEDITDHSEWSVDQPSPQRIVFYPTSARLISADYYHSARDSQIIMGSATATVTATIGDSCNSYHKEDGTITVATPMPLYEKELQQRRQPMSRRKWLAIAGLIICLLLMAIIIGIAVGVTNNKSDNRASQASTSLPRSISFTQQPTPSPSFLRVSPSPTQAEAMLKSSSFAPSHSLGKYPGSFAPSINHFAGLHPHSLRL